ncbi:MAG: uracil-DNA glycosylase family protein [Bacteroidaceae bacterium]|nr:uracil-DNA glycosylase family protein [Bacteroidaceae bacterium]
MNNTETHPWEPFIPHNARIMFLGSFPPPRRRWSMEFYYPNITNDFWKIAGWLFFGKKDHFIEENGKKFKENEIKAFLNEKGIALYDAAHIVRRLQENASDKFLEVIAPTDIISLLHHAPSCRAIVTTGQKATDIITEIFGCDAPSIGSRREITVEGRCINFWRMPSTSRAHPLAVEKKAEFYRTLLQEEGIL